MKIALYQEKPRYYSTGDYFVFAGRDLGYDMYLTTNTNDLQGMSFDVAIHMSPGRIIPAKKQLFLERDCWGQIFFNNQPQEKTFFCQYYDGKYDKWNDDHVILHAADPTIHKSVGNPEVDVVFAGYPYPGRMAFLERVKFELIKNGYTMEIHGDGRATPDYVNLLSRGKVILAPAEHGELNRRVFEAMAIGMCVTGREKHLDKIGEDGEHFLAFENRNVDDAVAVIDQVLRDDTLRNKIAKASRKHIIKNHTYKHRLKELLQKGGVLDE
jgi:glycosyltransferase involved in cell wall biosynthesis